MIPGEIIFLSGAILLGYFFGTHLEAILNWLDRFGLLIFALLIGLSLITWRFFRTSQMNWLNPLPPHRIHSAR